MEKWKGTKEKKRLKGNRPAITKIENYQSSRAEGETKEGKNARTIKFNKKRFGERERERKSGGWCQTLNGKL
jgi:hypothetical protein